MDQVSEELTALVAMFKGVALVRGKTIRISFTFEGKRENISLPDLTVNKNNVIAASNKLAAINYDIANGCFTWVKHFPKHAKVITASGVENIPTIQEAIESFIELKAASTRTLTAYTYATKAKKYIYPKFGDMRADKLKVTDVEKWRAKELGKLTNKTINEIFIPLRGAFQDLAKDRIINFNPLEHVKNLTIAKNKEQTCDPFIRNEIDAILERDTRFISERNAFIFACWSGLRPSELLALAWQDVDFKSRTIRVKRGIVLGDYQATKNNGSFRTVDLVEPAYQALLAQKAISFMLPPRNISVLDDNNRHSTVESLSIIFVNTRSNDPYHDSKTYGVNFFTPHLKLCGIRHRGIKQARHTFASVMLTAGIRERWIATQMGHSTLAMLEQHYAVFMKSEIPDMADQVSKTLGFEPTTKTTRKVK